MQRNTTQRCTEQNDSICSNMDATKDYHTKLSQKDKYHMMSLIRGIKNMAQINLPTKQKLIHRQTWLPRERGEGEEWTWSLGLVDGNHYIKMDKQ